MNESPQREEKENPNVLHLVAFLALSLSFHSLAGYKQSTFFVETPGFVESPSSRQNSIVDKARRDSTWLVVISR
jgi:hypothetical protein